MSFPSHILGLGNQTKKKTSSLPGDEPNPSGLRDDLSVVSDDPSGSPVMGHKREVRRTFSNDQVVVHTSVKKKM